MPNYIFSTFHVTKYLITTRTFTNHVNITFFMRKTKNQAAASGVYNVTAFKKLFKLIIGKNHNKKSSSPSNATSSFIEGGYTGSY